MPTARELLEQADALMRRNRERAEAERVAREAREPVPAEQPGVEKEAGAVPLAEARSDTLPDEVVLDEGIPELTDAVADESASVVDLRPPVSDLDDVPELTDAVEEIEAPSILELPVDEEEPSQWLEIERGEVSVTGPAPDSVLALPTELPPQAAVVVPTGPEVPTGAEAAAANEPAPLTAAAVSTGEFLVEPGADFQVTADEVDFGDRLPPLEQAVAAGQGAADQTAAPIYAVETLESPPSDAIAALAVPQPVAEPIAEPVAGPLPVQPTVGDTIAAAPDALHWDVLAEEIRMQVLQRIDIFTDTGLQEQLAARLQPIVDRASADLVATINREVGQLLRSYVAEAIEREIDKWRQEGR
jgi:hypothetical protein